MNKPKDQATPFQRFESLARQVFVVPKTKVAKALSEEKAAREKKRKAG